MKKVRNLNLEQIKHYSRETKNHNLTDSYSSVKNIVKDAKKDLLNHFLTLVLETREIIAEKDFVTLERFQKEFAKSSDPELDENLKKISDKVYLTDAQVKNLYDIMFECIKDFDLRNDYFFSQSEQFVFLDIYTNFAARKKREDFKNLDALIKYGMDSIISKQLVGEVFFNLKSKYDQKFAINNDAIVDNEYYEGALLAKNIFFGTATVGHGQPKKCVLLKNDEKYNLLSFPMEIYGTNHIKKTKINGNINECIDFLGIEVSKKDAYTMKELNQIYKAYINHKNNKYLQNNINEISSVVGREIREAYNDFELLMKSSSFLSELISLECSPENGKSDVLNKLQGEPLEYLISFSSDEELLKQIKDLINDESIATTHKTKKLQRLIVQGYKEILSGELVYENNPYPEYKDALVEEITKIAFSHNEKRQLVFVDGYVKQKKRSS